MKFVNIFFFIFVLSGFSGLIYESIWTHYLKLFLGHAAYAQSLVLAIFMGGMALGSWICSRYSSRWGNLFIGYAIAEGVIGLFALFFHDIFITTTRVAYINILPNIGTAFTANIFKWTLSALLILPQSILLGMTFPLMSSAIIRYSPHNSGKTISILYFTNSIGAAIGVLTSGFLLIKLTGLPGTVRIAGFINLLIAAFIFLLIRTRSDKSEHLTPEGVKETSRPYDRWYIFMLTASFITGMASFIYEIGWIRMLSLVLGSSTHAFELMLSSFIFGLAFGGLWLQSRINRIDPVHSLFIVQIAMGMLALSTLTLYGNTFEVMSWLVGNLDKTDTGYIIFNLSSNAIALAIMLPTTFCAGMTLPLITYALLSDHYGERSIGAVYAANTFGAIVGIFFAIHIGIQSIGLKGLMIFGSALDIGLGVALAWIIYGKKLNFRLPAVITAFAIGTIGLTLFTVRLDPYKMASGVYRTGWIATPRSDRLIYHRDGKTATISVLRSGDVMSIATNGKSDAAINLAPWKDARDDELTMSLLAIIPMAIKPDAETVANIGFGSGMTTHALLNNPRLKQVDTIEIERLIVEAAKNFGDRVSLAYKDPRSRIKIDDAKTFFSIHNKKYDIIISEPSNPWVSGVSGLFSEEFYQLAGRHLTRDGLFVQWLQIYDIDVKLVSSVLKAISSSFDDFVIYTTNDGDVLIVARNNGLIVEMQPDILKIPGIAALLDRVKIRNIQDLEIRKIANKKVLRRFLETTMIRSNSDYYPVLDQGASRTRFLSRDAFEFVKFTDEFLPMIRMLAGEPGPAGETNITQSQYISRSQAATNAMTLRDYYLSGNGNANLSQQFEILPTITRQNAIYFKQIFTECGSVTGPVRKYYLFETMRVMVPYLTADELNSILGVLKSRSCDPFSEIENKYLLLFKSIALKDPLNTASISEYLLKNDPDISQERERYLLAAGMFGYIAQGNKGAASQLWTAHKANIFKNSHQPDLLFQFLVANFT